MVQDYTELGTLTPIKLFNQKIEKASKKFTKEHEPFDEPCARIDIRDELEMVEKESIRRHGFINVKEIKIDVGDLERYGNPELFELIEDNETYDDTLSADGRKIKGIIGHTIDYRCKKRGHGISVFIPLEVYNERKGKEKK